MRASYASGELSMKFPRIKHREVYALTHIRIAGYWLKLSSLVVDKGIACEHKSVKLAEATR